MDQPRRQFLAETEDLIEQIFIDLDDLRENKDDAFRQRQLVDGIFRRLHRIKGSGATFGLDGLAEIAHEFETLLSAMRAGRVAADDDTLDLCESAASALSESLSLAASGVVESSRRRLFDRIHALAPLTDQKAARTGTNVDVILKQLPTAIWQSLTDEEKQMLARSVVRGTHLCVVATSFDIAGFDDQFYGLKEILTKHGEVIASSPAVDAEHSDQIRFNILFAGNDDLAGLEADLVGFPEVSLTRMDSAASASVNAQPAVLAAPTVPPFRSEAISSVSKFIRTDLDDLDRLISSTHELFTTTSRALGLAAAATGAPAREELARLSDEIHTSFLGVEDDLIGLRMVSLGPVLQRAARAGRSAARMNNKEIDFEIVGTTLRLDKLLCDAIADPLLHLVRNAVDHGIETAPARLKAGKPQRGRVRIEAATEGCQTRVRVIDDGCGVDRARVSEVANELGIVEADGVIDMDLSLRLIFRPGFSTLSVASAISGRGVGLDVVETTVEQVGGEVRVSSEPGRGSIFEIRLPLTFGLLRSAVVLDNNRRYCIDARQIVTTSPVETSNIRTENGRESLQSTEGTLPLVRLSALLGQPEGKTMPSHRLEVIMCELPDDAGDGNSGLLSKPGNNLPTERKLIGIVVDEVTGTEEVLVRNLGHHAGRWSGIAGATELRDGTVALVLDLPRLVSRKDFKLELN